MQLGDKLAEYIKNFSSYRTTMDFGDVAEILIIAVLLYYALVWMKTTRAWVLLKGLVVILIFLLLAYFFRMTTILWMAQNVLGFAVTALIVVLQPELRKALEELGKKNIISSVLPFDNNHRVDEGFSEKTINEITKACVEMGKVKTGALIVIEQKVSLRDYERTGIDVDGIVTSQLLINIFEHNTPLHDGAVIVQGNRVASATCYLPLSDNLGLSKELGTSLTGRHITSELFPFSFKEFCRFKDIEPNEHTTKEYMQLGGFPEYLKNPIEEILANLLDDILIRDIAVRYGIKDIRGLKRLTVFLLSNIGNLTSANKLREPAGINSTTTILEYLSHLEQSYLVSLVPMFDYSLKKQTINPKKIYAIDMGLVTSNVNRIKGDEGHKLENMVYNTLRLRYKDIYYHRRDNECDFITLEKGAITQAIQVCMELNADNQSREFDGLIDALKFYKLTEGYIITLNQEDVFQIENLKIKVIPYHKWQL